MRNWGNGSMSGGPTRRRNPPNLVVVCRPTEGRGKDRQSKEVEEEESAKQDRVR
jgi:hypothetical protein